MKTLFGVIAILALLAGCASRPVEIKTRYVVVSPSPMMMSDADIESPPDPEKYAALETFAKKEEVLTNLIASLYSSIGEVNKRLDAIRRSVENAQTIYKGESVRY